jgi:hypothetical protein
VVNFIRSKQAAVKPAATATGGTPASVPAAKSGAANAPDTGKTQTP